MTPMIVVIAVRVHAETVGRPAEIKYLLTRPAAAGEVVREFTVNGNLFVFYAAVIVVVYLRLSDVHALP